MLILLRPQQVALAAEQNMQYTPFNLIVAPLLAWMAVVSVLVVAYLASLEIQERRRNRRMNQERHRLGLRPSH
jgi:hypothetical protein